jgi:hypothetical protein
MWENGRMQSLSHPTQIAVLAMGLTVTIFLLTMAQRLGDWRSKTLDKVLVVLAALLAASLIYLAALWIVGVDLGVWLNKQGGWFWVSVFALSSIALLLWLWRGGRKSEKEKASENQQSKYNVEQSAKGSGNQQVFVGEQGMYVVNNLAHFGNLKQRLDDLIQTILREAHFREITIPSKTLDPKARSQKLYSDSNYLHWRLMGPLLEMRQELARSHMRHRDLDQFVGQLESFGVDRDPTLRIPLLPVQIKALVQALKELSDQIGSQP